MSKRLYLYPYWYTRRILLKEAMFVYVLSDNEMTIVK